MSFIFDVKVRNSHRPMTSGENLYDYYDQSDRPIVSSKRDALNRWASHYPQAEAPELRSRMRSSTRQFQAAELELALHEIFRRLAFQMAIHPEAITGKKFDLGILDKNLSAYVEITTLLTSDEEAAMENRTSTILNILNSLQLPKGHSFLVSIEECGDSSPSSRRIATKALQWVQSAAPVDEHVSPKLVIEEAGWVIELTLMNSGSDRIYERAVGGFTGGASWASPGKDLKAKLQSKSRRYGRPDRAFIIAIADFRMIATEPDEIAEALYGEWATVVERETLRTRRRFLPNGFFGHSARPQNTGVSAVLIVPCDPYWSAHKGTAKPVLYLNPFADRHVPPDVLPFAATYLDENGRLLEKDGPTLQHLLL